MWIFCIQKGEKLSNFRGSKSWRLILLFSVFAMVVVACGGDTAEEEVAEEAPETTAAPATTAAAAEEAAPSGPDVFIRWLYSQIHNLIITGHSTTQKTMFGQAMSCLVRLHLSTHYQYLTINL